MIVPTPFSPSKWGTRRLVARELAALHDVPILASDLFVKSGKEPLLRSFFDVAPGTVLAVGLDVMITSFLRGGVWAKL